MAESVALTVETVEESVALTIDEATENITLTVTHQGVQVPASQSIAFAIALG